VFLVDATDDDWLGVEKEDENCTETGGSIGVLGVAEIDFPEFSGAAFVAAPAGVEADFGPVN
jgi:hypothetical protein